MFLIFFYNINWFGNIYVGVRRGWVIHKEIKLIDNYFCLRIVSNLSPVKVHTSAKCWIFTTTNVAQRALSIVQTTTRLIFDTVEKHGRKHAQPSGGKRNRGIPDPGGLAGRGHGGRIFFLMLCYYFLNLLPLDTNNKCVKSKLINLTNSHMTDIVLKGARKLLLACQVVAL